MKDVRIFLKKTGRMKFISHLDMQRFMIRMIRRSGIPVWYSEGFNPHPYITFALPLSLGFETTYDVMDMRLDDDSFPLNTALEMLRGVMPDGIELFGIAEPVMKVGEIAFAKYEITFDGLSLERAKKLEAFLSSPEILTEKRNKRGKLNTVDLAPSIHSFEILGDKLSLIVAQGSAANLNPKLLLDTFEKLSGEALPFASYLRTMIYNKDMERFA